MRRQVGRSVLVVGAAVLGGICVAALAGYVLFFTRSDIVLWACPSRINSHSSAVCNSQHLLKMVWVLSCAGTVGVVASGIGASLLLRHRIRSLDSSTRPFAPTTSP